jgi:hypothetical protein
VNELRELRQLQGEKGKLKRLVPDLSLVPAHVAGDYAKKAVKPRQRRELGQWLQAVFAASCRRVSGPLMISRATTNRHGRRDP